MRGRIQESGDLSNRQVLAIFGRALRYVAPFRGAFAVKLLLTAASIAPLLILPWPVKILIDHVIEGAPIAEKLASYPVLLRPLVALLADMSWQAMLAWTVSVQAFLVLAVGAMGTTGRERDQTDAFLSSGHDTATRTENEANLGWSFAGGLLGLYDFAWTLRLSQRINHYYRSQLFERIQTLPMTAFDDERIGDAIYRVMYDTPSITLVCYRVLLSPIVVPLAIIGFALWMPQAQSGRTELFWIALLFIPFIMLVTYPFGGLIRRTGVRSRQAGSETTSTVEEGMSNILAVQSLGGEGRERSRFDRDSWASFSQYRMWLVAGMLTFVAALVPGLFIVGWGFVHVGDLVVTGEISKGDFTVVFSYFITIASLSVDLGALWIRLQSNAPGLHRVFFLMDLPSEVDPPDAAPLAPIRRGVRIEDVSFEYADGTPALHDIDLDAPIGKVVALVGPAGAGKTTLVSLVPRFLEPTRGRVTIDGVDIAGVTNASLRSQVSFVFQENVLFDGTIEENIRLGKLDATDLEVRRAAQTAGADEYIRSLPDGYGTPLGRAGAKLSVGQKQRLAIARALVRDAPILILDEPTSALDPDTERRVVSAIRAAASTRLVFVIAHRLSTVRAADEILFLQRGRILERGSHEELMAIPDGAYRRYVELQTRGAA